MSLASGLTGLQTDLKNAITKASNTARLQSDQISLTEDMTAADISSLVADKFSDVFATSLSQSMAPIIRDYVKNATVVFKLANSGGTVTGEITLT